VSNKSNNSKKEFSVTNFVLVSLKFGMPWDEKVQITPLPEEDKFKYLNDCIADAESKGAKIMNQNGAVQNGTLFFPAVMYPVNEGMKLYREEQFGPIVPIVTFNDLCNLRHGIIVCIYL
jgi:acyl-CoA reductase-like NAD-dependent aldehyde dehydrogenase